MSGTIYAAHLYANETVNGQTVATTVAARMIQYANTLTNLAYTCNGATIADGDGSGFTYKTCDTANPKDPVIAAKLHGYVSNLDEALSLSAWWTEWDYGNVNNP
jgi:hypothetical protein